MKKVIICLIAAGLLAPIFPAPILITGIPDVAVQSFSGNEPITGFSVHGPDENGFVYLTANTSEYSGDLIRTRSEGTALQDYSFLQGEYLVGFEVSSRDGYNYLTVVGSKGSTGEVLRTQTSGLMLRAITAPQGEAITELTAYLDEDGHACLTASSADVGESDFKWLYSYSLELAEIVAIDETLISYSVAEATNVSVSIYDASGRLVTELVESEHEPGRFEAVWQTKDASAGVYFIKMVAGEFNKTKKLTVIR